MRRSHHRALIVPATVLAVLVAAGCSMSSSSGVASARGMVPAEDLRAAERGDPAARYRVAKALTDQGAYAQAWPQACLAATEGSVEAQRLVGEYYWRGHAPVAQDREQAYVWYATAEKDTPATNLTRIDVAMEMTPEEVARATAKAKGFKPEPGMCHVATGEAAGGAAVAAPAPAKGSTPRPRPKG